MKRTPERGRESVYMCKTVCIVDCGGKNGDMKNDEMAGGKMRGNVSAAASSQSPAFSFIDSPTFSRLHLATSQFSLTSLALLSHFSFFRSLCCPSRVRASRVVSWPPLSTLTTLRGKLVRRNDGGTLGLFAAERYFPAPFPCSA